MIDLNIMNPIVCRNEATSYFETLYAEDLAFFKEKLLEEVRVKKYSLRGKNNIDKHGTEIRFFTFSVRNFSQSSKKKYFGLQKIKNRVQKII